MYQKESKKALAWIRHIEYLIRHLGKLVFLLMTQNRPICLDECPHLSLSLLCCAVLLCSCSHKRTHARFLPTIQSSVLLRVRNCWHHMGKSIDSIQEIPTRLRCLTKKKVQEVSKHSFFLAFIAKKCANCRLLAVANIIGKMLYFY